MNRRLLRVLVLSAVVAAATLAVGWWVVPLVGGVYGFVAVGRSGQHPVLTPVMAGFAGWAALLAWRLVAARGYVVADTLGGVMGLPAWGVLLVTPLFAALLAGAAALFTSGLRR